MAAPSPSPPTPARPKPFFANRRRPARNLGSDGCMRLRFDLRSCRTAGNCQRVGQKSATLTLRTAFERPRPRSTQKRRRRRRASTAMLCDMTDHFTYARTLVSRPRTHAPAPGGSPLRASTPRRAEATSRDGGRRGQDGGRRWFTWQRCRVRVPAALTCGRPEEPARPHWRCLRHGAEGKSP